jgi:hemerythrin
MIPIFNWNEAFLTHIPTIDDQHQSLLGMINNLGEIVMSSDEIDPVSFSLVREGLLNYARVHFSDEEVLMKRMGLDHRHVNRHMEAHRTFMSDALKLCDLNGSEGKVSFERAILLVDFLVKWLACHMLEVDQSMARQVFSLQQGHSPEEAYEFEEQRTHSHMEPLLSALSGLFHMVSKRNSELRAMNRELEQRVALRTAELERANQRLAQLSTHDDLTGLPNRRFAIQSLDQLLLEKARYHDEGLSVLMLDADHFKAVNDRFGHAQGDTLLRTLAERLRQSVRASDIVCRLGGDEFLIICPRGTREGALNVARLILETSQPCFTPDGVECWDGAISIGIAEAEGDLVKPEDLLGAADQALYASKHKKGGCVT